MRTQSTFTTILFAALLGCSGGAAGTFGSGGAPASSAAGGTTAALCADGFADCDGDPANGCEAALHTSTKSCGACGHACAAGASASAVCAAGECAIACDPGTADCDGKPENGCETAIASDPKSCGACGLACDKSCSNGTCDLAVLAKDQVSPVDVAADASGAYWISFGTGKAADGALMRVDLAGGAATVMAAALVGPRALLLGADDVFCATSDAILRVPKAGGAAVPIASKQALPVALGMQKSTLYWANAGTPPGFADSELMSLDLSDPNAAPGVVGALPAGVVAIAPFGDAIYGAAFGSGQASDGALLRFPASAHDATAEIVAKDLASPHAFAATGDTLFLAVRGAILSLPAGGAAPKPFLQALVHQPVLLATGSERLWWTTVGSANGEVQSVKLDGTDLRTRAKNLSQPRGIAVLAGDVYLTEVSVNGSPGTGVVARAAKP